MALMNARYYLQTNAASVAPPELRVRQDIYPPKLRINKLQDDKLQMDVSDDVVLHTTRPIQAIMVGNCIIFDARVLITRLIYSYRRRGQWKCILSRWRDRLLVGVYYYFCVSLRAGLTNNIWFEIDYHYLSAILKDILQCWQGNIDAKHPPYACRLQVVEVVYGKAGYDETR
jgi:hypothetical protein